jgi:hypothetical protein
MLRNGSLDKDLPIMPGGFQRRKQLEIHPERPFAEDKLGFEAQVPGLTRLLEKTPGPYVIGINAKYGIGKTTFLKMWRAYLSNEGAQTLYFDAWEHDFIEPPLTALIGELEAQVNAIKGASKAKRNLHKAGIAAAQALAPIAAKEVSKLLLSVVASAIAPGASSALSQAFKHIAEAQTGQAVADSLSSMAKDRIQLYEQEKKTLSAFRRSLQEFALAVASSGRKSSAANRFLPLVFFVDELDRCRPTYAIELLETLKHLFSVEGVVFVLGINRDALVQSLSAVYGSDFPGHDYLKRFIDLQYTLPNPPLKDFCAQLSDEFIPTRTFPFQPNANYYFWLEPSASEISYASVMAFVCVRFAPSMDRSLRDLEQIFARAGAALATLPPSKHVEPSYFAFLMLCQEAAPKQYRSFINGGNGSAFLKALADDVGLKLRDSDPLHALIMECVACQHDKDGEINKRRSDYRARSQQTGMQGIDFVRYGLLLHEAARIKSAPQIVELAGKFDER